MGILKQENNINTIVMALDLKEIQELIKFVAKSGASEVDLDAYAAVDGVWRELGLAAPARRALIDEGLYKVSDLRKYSLDAIKDLHGMGPNAIRILITAMKKSDISFR